MRILIELPHLVETVLLPQSLAQKVPSLSDSPYPSLADQDGSRIRGQGIPQSQHKQGLCCRTGLVPCTQCQTFSRCWLQSSRLSDSQDRLDTCLLSPPSTFPLCEAHNHAVTFEYTAAMRLVPQ